jgi:hypothetical protein
MNIDKNQLYEAALKQPRGPFKQALLTTWLVVGLISLTAFAWFEPFSLIVFRGMIAHGVSPAFVYYFANPLLMMLKAVLLVETIGYGYHRFFQHVGWLTRRAQVVRRNQKFHWLHHMVIYPVGRLYRRNVPYVPAEDGIDLSWIVPAVIVASLFVFSHGVNLGTLAFLAGMYMYARLVVDKTHSLFHETKHALVNNRYFQWLEKIHILHHFDQRTNFTIVFPAMDVLFGTYRSPGKNERELSIAIADEDLTVSDLINWRYLLIEASPAEYAAFISNARKHPRSLRKVDNLLEVLNARHQHCPDDRQASDLLLRAERLISLCRKTAQQG